MTSSSVVLSRQASHQCFFIPWKVESLGISSPHSDFPPSFADSAVYTLHILDSLLLNIIVKYSAGETLKGFKLQAGDDAGAVTWMAVTSKLNLYASHSDFIHKVVKLRQAAW